MAATHVQNMVCSRYQESACLSHFVSVKTTYAVVRVYAVFFSRQNLEEIIIEIFLSFSVQLL